MGNFLHVNLTQRILSHLSFHFQFITGDKLVPYFEKHNFLVSSTMKVLVLLFRGGIAGIKYKTQTFPFICYLVVFLYLSMHKLKLLIRLCLSIYLGDLVGFLNIDVQFG